MEIAGKEKATKHLTLAVLGFSLLSLGTAHAQGFVRFQGIDGPVTADGYEAGVYAVTATS